MCAPIGEVLYTSPFLCKNFYYYMGFFVPDKLNSTNSSVSYYVRGTTGSGVIENYFTKVEFISFNWGNATVNLTLGAGGTKKLSISKNDLIDSVVKVTRRELEGEFVIGFGTNGESLLFRKDDNRIDRLKLKHIETKDIKKLEVGTRMFLNNKRVNFYGNNHNVRINNYSHLLAILTSNKVNVFYDSFKALNFVNSGTRISLIVDDEGNNIVDQVPDDLPPVFDRYVSDLSDLSYFFVKPDVSKISNLSLFVTETPIDIPNKNSIRLQGRALRGGNDLPRLNEYALVLKIKNKYISV